MAVVASKGVGVKLSWGSAVGAGGVDLRPVMESQLNMR
jgi:hypothetical protein